MNKKGVSPLIATIFLIAVSVALGSIVMSLGQDYVSQASPDSPSCDVVTFNVKNINYFSSTNSISIAIDNGDQNIDGFLIKLFNQDYSQGSVVTLAEKIDAHGVKILSFNSETSDVYEIKIIPISSDNVCNTASKEVTRNSPLFKVQ